ncbi:MAG: aldose 1-epimerase family protein [Erysipelotrichaceae bacterium]
MQISNNKVKVEFIKRCAQISSFKKQNSEKEFMWQGDPKYWGDRNPVLFPMVGNTYSQEYQIDGKVYKMKNHGLVRYMDFELVAQENDFIEFKTQANQETLKRYPFNFEFIVRYSLENSRLVIKYTILNKDNKVMPFTFGLHPAFNTFENFEDYKVALAENEDNLFQIIDGDKVKISQLQEFNLSRSELDKYGTIIYQNFKSEYLDLISSNDTIRIGFKGYKYLAFWSKPNAPFICVEPWYGLGELKNTGKNFEKLEGMMSLEPNNIFETSYYIELL